ncbi:MAG: WD40/YVTN/BNR-like repeat-containing protein [Phycisphaerae bacterium]
MRDLALSPDFANDRTAVLLSGEDGVFRTTDGGDTWERVSEVAGHYAALATTASGPLTFLVLVREPDVYDQTFVYAPAGAAGALEQIGSIPSSMLPGSDALALSPEFARDGVAIAGLYQAGLFLSQDSGRTWHQLPPRPQAFSAVYTILFSPEFASDRTVYALMAPSYFGPEDRSVLVRSTDGGETWQRAVDADPLISALAMGPVGDLWVGDAQGNVRPLDPAQLAWEIAREPTPTPEPTPSEPPAGFYRPTGAFAEMWATDPEVRRALGWAAEPEPRQISAAFQPFEGGVMIWRGDTRTIYVLYDDGSWDGFEDTWTPEEPDLDPNIQPLAGLEQPARGFGKVWREQPGVRDRLGWGLRSEEAYASPLQSFERGTAMGVGASVFVLTRVAGEPATWLER